MKLQLLFVIQWLYSVNSIMGNHPTQNMSVKSSTSSAQIKVAIRVNILLALWQWLTLTSVIKFLIEWSSKILISSISSRPTSTACGHFSSCSHRPNSLKQTVNHPMFKLDSLLLWCRQICSKTMLQCYTGSDVTAHTAADIVVAVAVCSNITFICKLHPQWNARHCFNGLDTFNRYSQALTCLLLWEVLGQSTDSHQCLGKTSFPLESPLYVSLAGSVITR